MKLTQIPHLLPVLIATALFIPAFAQADTTPTPILGNVTWTKAAGPYIVNSTTIPAGSSLTIEPGTIVKASGDVFPFIVDGDNLVEKPEYKEGNVYINKTQYFGGVPEAAWNFYIGGYQPAQKWLKDRKGKVLSGDDLTHYQKIIIVLTETDRIMGEIDQIKFT